MSNVNFTSIRTEVDALNEAIRKIQQNMINQSSADPSSANFTQMSAATGLAETAASLQATAAGKEILAGPVTRTGNDGKVYQLQLENTDRGPAVRVNVSSASGSDSSSKVYTSSQVYIGQDKFGQYCAKRGIADNPFPIDKK